MTSSAGHPKTRLHDAIQASMHEPELVPSGEDLLLARWALIGEVVLSEDRLGIVTITSTASGDDLRSWEQVGLYMHALARALRSPNA